MKNLIIKATIGDKEYQVFADNVTISENGVQTDNAEILVDGKSEDDFGENFVGEAFSASDVAEELVRSYINSNREVNVIYACEDILEFAKDFCEPSEFQSPEGRLISKKYLDSIGVLELVMLDKGYNSYYTDGESYILLREDGSVATDMEVFFMNAYLESEENGTYIWKKG